MRHVVCDHGAGFDGGGDGFDRDWVLPAAADEVSAELEEIRSPAAALLILGRGLVDN